MSESDDRDRLKELLLRLPQKADVLTNRVGELNAKAGYVAGAVRTFTDAHTVVLGSPVESTTAVPFIAGGAVIASELDRRLDQLLLGAETFGQVIEPAPIQPDQVSMISSERYELLHLAALPPSDRRRFSSFMLLTGAFCLTFISACAGVNEPSPEAVARGRDLFARTCTSCHAADGTGTRLGPDVTSAQDASHRTYAEVRDAIESGVPPSSSFPAGMPPAGGTRMSADEVDALTAFVWFLRSARER